MKATWLVGVFLLNAVAGRAQSIQAPPWRMGLLAGYAFTCNTSIPPFDVLSRTGGRSGFHGGVTLTFVPRPEIGLQAGLLFSQKGYVLSGGGGGFLFSSSNSATYWRLNYLDLPVALQWHPWRAKRQGLFVEVGPQASYLLSATYQTQTTTSTGNTRTDRESATEEYRRVVGGFLVGVGYQSSRRISLGLRYTQDLVAMKPEIELPPGVFLKTNWAKNWGVQLQAGYQFGRR